MAAPPVILAAGSFDPTLVFFHPVQEELGDSAEAGIGTAAKHPESTPRLWVVIILPRRGRLSGAIPAEPIPGAHTKKAALFSRRVGVQSGAPSMQVHRSRLGEMVAKCRVRRYVPAKSITTAYAPVIIGPVTSEAVTHEEVAIRARGVAANCVVAARLSICPATMRRPKKKSGFLAAPFGIFSA